MKTQYSTGGIFLSVLLSVSLLSTSAFASSTADQLNGVWSLDSATCIGEGSAVDEMNKELKEQFPSDFQEILVIDGTVGSLMVNDPHGDGNDACNILVEGGVTSTDSDVTLTAKYPVAIGTSTCKVDSQSGKFLRKGSALISVGSDNHGVCKEIDFSFSRMGS
jgi:hypothetical protein